MRTSWNTTRQFQCRLYFPTVRILFHISGNINNDGHGKDNGYGPTILLGSKQHLISNEPTLLLISIKTARVKESLQKKRKIGKKVGEGTRAA